jgi:hypothetical protein
MQKTQLESGNSFSTLEDSAAEGNMVENDPPITPSIPEKEATDPPPVTNVAPSQEAPSPNAQQDPGTEEDLSEEEEGEMGPLQSTKKTSRRGRKSTKERREEATYKDKLQGGQSTLEGLFNPRITWQQGKISKGTATTSRGK